MVGSGITGGQVSLARPNCCSDTKNNPHLCGTKKAKGNGKNLGAMNSRLPFSALSMLAYYGNGSCLGLHLYAVQIHFLYWHQNAISRSAVKFGQASPLQDDFLFMAV